MGGEASRLDEHKMPSYYIARPTPDVRKSIHLANALQILIHGEEKKRKKKQQQRGNAPVVEDRRNVRLPFTNFYAGFFERLKALEAKGDELQSGVAAYFEYDLEQQSIFLIRLLKLIVEAPRYAILQKNGGKWQSGARKILKKFLYDYWGLSIHCFGYIGEALFHAVEKFDSTASDKTLVYWTEAYSLLLAQIIPMITAKEKRFGQATANGKSFGYANDSSKHKTTTSPRYSLRSATPSRSFRFSKKEKHEGYSHGTYPAPNARPSRPRSNPSPRPRTSPSRPRSSSRSRSSSASRGGRTTSSSRPRPNPAFQSESGSSRSPSRTPSPQSNSPLSSQMSPSSPPSDPSRPSSSSHPPRPPANPSRPRATPSRPQSTPSPQRRPRTSSSPRGRRPQTSPSPRRRPKTGPNDPRRDFTSSTSSTHASKPRKSPLKKSPSALISLKIKLPSDSPSPSSSSPSPPGSSSPTRARSSSFLRSKYVSPKRTPPRGLPKIQIPPENVEAKPPLSSSAHRRIIARGDHFGISKYDGRETASVTPGWTTRRRAESLETVLSSRLPFEDRFPNTNIRRRAFSDVGNRYCRPDGPSSRTLTSSAAPFGPPAIYVHRRKLN